MLLALIIVIGVLVLLGLFLVVLVASADYRKPDVEIDRSKYILDRQTDEFRSCAYGSMQKNAHGLWEAKVYGGPVDRGCAFGAMSADLLEHQENVFVSFIRTVLGSDRYMRFLYYVTVLFTRRMARYIPEENRKEIYALSTYCSTSFNSFGKPYFRQMNYHAAHDIGHMMQDYMLVGCTSFAVWGKESADGALLVARNFDFYAGEGFSRNRIILFVAPDQGHKYVSVTWPGMTGVISGMNEKGLTVTLNAAKGKIPMSASLPVSLLARQILQYAGNIEEALEIARRGKTFVSETFLISSREDSRAVVIEKTAKATAVHEGVRDGEGGRIICTNHFQSAELLDDDYNKENMSASDSTYRYARVSELLDSIGPVGVGEAVSVLRDRSGLAGAGIGEGNPKAVHQAIAHHSVLFCPESLKMWVSTEPWQSGEFICYDMEKAFSSVMVPGTSLALEELSVPADEDYIIKVYPGLMEYRSLCSECKAATRKKIRFDVSRRKRMVTLNPEYYETYEIIGDNLMSAGCREEAMSYWLKALEKEIPTEQIRNNLNKKISK